VNEQTIGLLIKGMTLNQRKKLKNKINGCIHKKSMRAINTFLHFLHRHVYKETTTAPCVKVSEKEERIQKARKEYVEARKLAMEYHKAYKDEKGDFYKNRIAR
jgi:flagellar biosynthesis chaperone FliJ